jgi:hypothetical protein
MIPSPVGAKEHRRLAGRVLGVRTTRYRIGDSFVPAGTPFYL